MTSGSFEQAISDIDAINAQDPNTIDSDGEIRPAELVYGQRMTAVLADLYPKASQLLQLAVRAQHVRRWSVPRSDYPMDRAGYHRWRNDLKRKHAGIAADVLSARGFTDDDVARVQSLIEKKSLKSDAEAQALEDVACIVFLKHYAEAFSAKHSDEKMIVILRKSWGKMSEQARSAALSLELPDRLTGLIKQALAAD